jgi:hypothetical protein
MDRGMGTRCLKRRLVPSEPSLTPDSLLADNSLVPESRSESQNRDS